MGLRYFGNCFAISLTFAMLVAMLGNTGAVSADPMKLKWSSEGYYRLRSVSLTNMQPEDRWSVRYGTDEETVLPDIRKTSYVMQALRIIPRLTLGEKAKGKPAPVTLNVQIDGMSDVLWGDNNGLSASPLFATNPTNQHFLGGSQCYLATDPNDSDDRTRFVCNDNGPSVAITRAWLQFHGGLGVFRVGRMASHWGLGLLANGGGTENLSQFTDPEDPAKKAQDHFFDDDFGDNHFGSTADRLLFITKPLEIFRTIRNKVKKTHDDVKSNLLMGYSFASVSEAPYLYAEPFSRRFRPFAQQGFISRGANDDVAEHVFLVLYNDAKWFQKRYTDELRVGVYLVNRSADESSTNPSADELLDPNNKCGEFDGESVPCVDTGSSVWIVDLWWRVRYGAWYTEGEFVYITGETFGGVPFPKKNEKKSAAITGGVARFGHVTNNRDLILELGHASGDDNLGDDKFKQRALHPDYNVGLILFEEILRERTARQMLRLPADGTLEGAVGLSSKGGVMNANYIHPKIRYRPNADGTPFPTFEIVAGILMAWIDTLPVTGFNTSIWPAEDTVDNTGFLSSDRYLGTEIDVALKANFHQKHLQLSLEAGYLKFGSALKTMLPNADHSVTFQTRLAFVW